MKKCTRPGEKYKQALNTLFPCISLMIFIPGNGKYLHRVRVLRESSNRGFMGVLIF